jgi:ABC-type lipoprotein export system ATPase subunit
MQSERGSLWKKWDLHVHTPDSLVQYYGANNADTWERFIRELESLPEDIKVLGINDYIFISGYRKLIDAQKAGRLKNIELLLPVIELRLNKFGGTNSELSRVNYHIIFNDRVDTDTIQSQFINSLTTKFELTPRYYHIQDVWKATPTQESLEELGRMIIESVPADERKHFGSPLSEGFNNLNFDINHLNGILDKSCFKDKFLTGIGKTEWWNIKWNDHSIADKKTIINEVDFVFTAASSVDEYYKSFSNLQNSKVNCHLLDCSDSHRFSESQDKDRLGRCATWIKGDTSFLGLQFALREFADRVFVGDKPEIISRVKSNGSLYIDKLTIKKKPESTLHETWFDNSLEFSHGLVAIIGNRGSGKSALSETIGLCGNTWHDGEFSFLNERKFKKRSDNKAKEFIAGIMWANNLKFERYLSDQTNHDSPELVQFIPQNFLEQICNEVPVGEDNDFSKELKRVIFSHIDIADRLGQTNLDDLINSVTGSTQEAIQLIQNEINAINNEVIGFENQLTESYRFSLEKQLSIRWQQLKDLRNIRPAIVQPIADSPEMQELTLAIESINQQIFDTSAEIQEKSNELAMLNIQLNQLARFEESISSLERQFSTSQTQYKQILATIGLDFDEIVKIIILKTPITDKRNEITNRISGLSSELDTTNLESLHGIISFLQSVKTTLQTKLDEPQKVYQDSLRDLEQWKQKRRELIGDKNTPDTVIFLRAKIREIETIPNHLQVANDKRRSKSREVYQLLKKLVTEYQRFYQGVQDFIDKQVAAKEIKLNLSVMLVQNNFDVTFLDYFNRRFASSFSPISEGDKLVRDTVTACDFDSETSVLQFIEKIDKYMHFNVNYDPLIAVDVDSLLRRGKTKLEVYNYLFGISYIKPKYILKFGSKQLYELSPGEKGTILLIFYLLVDKNEKPLIIDQPEDNLDNQTVTKILVNCIKQTKRRRQIFIVTHNPNLAVVCDADQIISCAIDKEKNNTVSYSCGSIENPKINPNVVDILEGTKPAFNIRGGKYFEDELLRR